MIPHVGDELSSGTLSTLIMYGIHRGKYLDSLMFHVELNFSHLMVRRTERLKHMERFFFFFFPFLWQSIDGSIYLISALTLGTGYV